MLLDEVNNRIHEEDLKDVEKKKIEKIVLKKEIVFLNAMSFQLYQSKKRYLPVETKPCWKSNGDTE